MQNLDKDDSFEFTFQQYRVQPDDILKITITTEDLKVSASFDGGIQNLNSMSKESQTLNGYQIDTNGLIDLPQLGLIKVEDMTIYEVRDHIRKLLVDRDIVTKPSVDIKLLNSYFSVIGEVNRPGKYEFLKNNINILEAIAIAGDLTINGERKNIKVIRKEKNTNRVISLDLRKKEFLTSEAFQIISGDIILVNPNMTRVKNAGIIGNSGTLLSLLSFILSSIIVINNN